MNKRQRELRALLHEVIETCRLRGIGRRELRQPVHDIFTRDMFEDDPNYQHGWEQADEISSAGVAAQLSFLLEAWGEYRLRRELDKLGLGVLDAIVQVTSSTPEELEAEMGLENINDDGYVS